MKLELRTNNRIGNTRGGRIAIGYSPVSMLPGDDGKELLQCMLIFQQFTKRAPSAPGLSLTSAFQAITRQVAEQSVVRGFNALDMDPDVGNYVCSVFHGCLPFDDIVVKEFSRELHESIDKYMREYENHILLHQTPGVFQQDVFGRGMSQAPYTFPLLMNEAVADQPLIENYGTRSLQRLWSIKIEVDSQNFWSNRTVGWRV